MTHTRRFSAKTTKVTTTTHSCTRTQTHTLRHDKITEMNQREGDKDKKMGEGGKQPDPDTLTLRIRLSDYSQICAA